MKKQRPPEGIKRGGGEKKIGCTAHTHTYNVKNRVSLPFGRVSINQRRRRRRHSKLPPRERHTYGSSIKSQNKSREKYRHRAAASPPNTHTRVYDSIKVFGPQRRRFWPIVSPRWSAAAGVDTPLWVLLWVRSRLRFGEHYIAVIVIAVRSSIFFLCAEKFDTIFHMRREGATKFFVFVLKFPGREILFFFHQMVTNILTEIFV